LSINTSFDKFDKRAFDPNAKSIPCLALGVSLVGRPSLALVLVSLGKGYQIGLMYTLNKLRRCRHRARRNRQAFAYFSCDSAIRCRGLFLLRLEVFTPQRGGQRFLLAGRSQSGRTARIVIVLELVRFRGTLWNSS
jgi:hypothetical protein